MKWIVLGIIYVLCMFIAYGIMTKIDRPDWNLDDYFSTDDGFIITLMSIFWIIILTIAIISGIIMGLLHLGRWLGGFVIKILAKFGKKIG